MRFTVVFDGQESNDASFGLVFIPCATWVRGGRTVATPNPGRPSYERGGLAALLGSPEMAESSPSGPRRALVVVHEEGHGTDQDLAALRDDLLGAGYNVSEIRVGDGQRA